MKKGLVLRLLAILALTSLISACSTHKVNLSYDPAHDGKLMTGEIAGVDIRVGTFRDIRDAGERWLGAIRGGYGNPLKKLYTTQPMHAVVEKVLRQALEKRGMLAEAGEAANYELRGTVRKLDTSQYFNLEAHAHLDVTLLHLPTAQTVFTRSVRVDREEGGFGAGIFGNVEHLRAFAEETLNIAVDRILSDSRLADALRSSKQLGTTAQRDDG